MLKRYTASLLAIAVAMPTALWAQAAAPADSAAPPAETGLADIIVTANRRAENVQKSSVSIDVLSSDALVSGGVSRVADLQNLVPSLSSASSGQNVSTYIRGVGSFSTDANSDSSIAYNINGVFISRPSGVGPVFFDLDRVEVLKGPQGTLYGRNASGGAINLITKRPTSQLSAEGAVDFGNYGAVRVFGAASGPVTDTLGIRIAAQYNKHDGYLTDGYNDQKDFSARATALWKPAPNISLLVVGEYSQARGQGSGPAFRSSLQANPSDPWTGPSQAPQPQAALIGPDKILTDGFVHTNIYAVSGELNWDFGGATLTFIPAYRNTKPTTLTYQPGFYFAPAETAEQQSYELRLGHTSSQLKWVVGAYYFKEDQTQDYTLLARPIQQNHIVSELGTNSYAFFGEATYSVTDALRLIGGLRYSNDKKSQDGVSTGLLPTLSVTSNYGRRKDDNVSFRVGGEFDLAPQNMLFATVSTGYKAGGFFPSVVFPYNTYKPEKLTAYTIGSRNRFFENRLQVNLEGFYWKYHNKQERFLGVLPSGGTGLETTNAGAATLYGADLDIVAKLGTGILRVSGEYLHTRYDSFSYTVANAGPLAPLGYSSLATSCAIGALTVVAPTLSTQSIDCAGKPLPHAPKWTGSVSFEQPFVLGPDTRLTPGASVKFASSMYLSPDFISTGRDNGYATLDLTLTLEHRNFSITGWARNLTNEAIYSGGFRYPFSFHEPAGDPTLFYADIRPPRTYGVTLKARY